jgi:serine/threonine protein kinase
MDMAKGMQFLHSQKPPIIHNDLKTPNVLMMGLDINMPVLAKVSDFGLSMQVSKMYKRLVDNPVWFVGFISNSIKFEVDSNSVIPPIGWHLRS